MGASCVYRFAYSSHRCGAETNGGLVCDTHAVRECSSCGAQATQECDYCGQFVCGAPLCDDCQGFEDRSKDSGAWGFMNHSHRRKPTPPPPEGASNG
jgi:hypothetical protein